MSEKYWSVDSDSASLLKRSMTQTVAAAAASRQTRQQLRNPRTRQYSTLEQRQ